MASEMRTFGIILEDVDILLTIRDRKEETLSLNKKIPTSDVHLLMILPQQRHPIRLFLKSVPPVS
jgi:hypothetical protein